MPYKDPAVQKAYQRGWYIKNADRVYEKTQIWRKANRERYRALTRAAYWRDPAKERSRSRRWRLSNVESERKRGRVYKERRLTASDWSKIRNATSKLKNKTKRVK